MSVSYYNDHSITFIRTVNGTTATSYKRSWYDFGLIPLSRPSVVTPPPRLKLINIPGSNTRLDLTDVTPGGLTFERRKGSWEFYVDTSKWNSWAEAKNAIESYLNGSSCYVVLEDNHERYYTGRIFITGWDNEESYPIVEIGYDFFYPVSVNNFQYSLTPVLLTISSSLLSGHTIYDLGEPVDKARRWIVTTATYDNGRTEYVDIDRLSGSFNTTGDFTITTSYYGKTSQVVCTVTGSDPVSLEAVLKSGKNKLIWLGSNKDDIRTIYNFYPKYENGYVDTNSPQTIESIDGIFTNLGNISVDVESNDIQGSADVFVGKVQTLSPYLITDAPEYARVGEWKDRLSYFMRVTGYTNGNYTVNYSSYTDLTLESTKFSQLVSDNVEVTTSDKAIGQYSGTVFGLISIPTREAYGVIDSWETVDNAIANGTYKEIFNVGDIVPLVIPDVYNGYAQIVGFDKDWGEDNDTIPISWMLKEALPEPFSYTPYYNAIYTNSTLKTYVDSMDDDLPTLVQSMIVPSIKEIGYYDRDEAEQKFTTSSLRLWIPSDREIYAQNERVTHDDNNIDIIYDDMFSTRTERIKFNNSLSLSSHSTNPVQWYTRNLYSDGLLFVNVLGTLTLGSYYATQLKNVIFGFCTGASVYDENSSWVLRKFRAFARTLGLYQWNPFGLREDSTLNNITEAMEAEIDQHVVEDPDLSTDGLLYPAVVFKLSSETSENYIYRVLLCDYDRESDFITAYKEQFNMTVNNTRQRGDYFIVTCTMTTNKRITE